MLTIITTFHMLAALAIIALVLLQQGKGADPGPRSAPAARAPYSGHGGLRRF